MAGVEIPLPRRTRLRLSPRTPRATIRSFCPSRRTPPRSLPLPSRRPRERMVPPTCHRRSSTGGAPMVAGSPFFMFLALVATTSVVVQGFVYEPSELSYFDDLRSLPAGEVGATSKGGSPVWEVIPVPIVPPTTTAPATTADNGDDNVTAMAVIGAENTTVSISGRNNNKNGVTEEEEEESDPQGGEENMIRLVHLASVLPLTHGKSDKLHPNSVTANAAAAMAMVHFNTKNGSIVPDVANLDHLSRCNIRLTMDIADSEFIPTSACEALVEELLPKPGIGGGPTLARPKPAGIMGALRSAVSGPLSILAGLYEIPVLAFGSKSNKLDNKGTYPYFGRTIPIEMAAVAVSYLRKELNVTHMSVLHVQDDYGTAFYSKFHQLASRLDPPMTIASVAYDWKGGGREALSAAMDQVNQAGYNYVFAITGTTPLSKIVEAATEYSSLMGPGKFWLFDEGHRDILEPHFAWDTKNDTESKLVRAADGLRYLRLAIPHNEAYNRAFTELAYDGAFRAYVNRKHPPKLNLSDTYDFWIGEPQAYDYMTYDLIMSFGIAACEARRNHFRGEEFLRSLRSTAFQGASGYVRFDRTTGTRDSADLSYKVMAMEAGMPNETGAVTFSESVVAEQEAFHDGTHLWVTDPQAVFADGSNVPPPNLSPIELKVERIPSGVLALGYGLASGIVLLSLGFIAWTIKFRLRGVVRISQPVFLVMLCVGAILMALSMFFMGVQGSTASKGVLDASCMAVPWFFFVGFVVSLSALFSKTKRMKEIWTSSQRLRRIKVRYRDILKPFLILLTCTIGILISWTAVSSSSWTPVVLSYDQYGRVTSMYGHCSSTSGGMRISIFFVLLWALNVITLSIAAFQTYLSRKVASEYNEGMYISMSIGSILETFFISVPLFLIPTKSPTAEYLIEIVLVALICLAALLPIFVPKINALKREKLAREARKYEIALKRERQALAGLMAMNLQLQSELDRIGGSGADEHAKIKVSTIRRNSLVSPELLAELCALGTSTIDEALPANLVYAKHGSERTRSTMEYSASGHSGKNLKGSMSSDRPISLPPKFSKVITKSEFVQMNDSDQLLQTSLPPASEENAPAVTAVASLLKGTEGIAADGPILHDVGEEGANASLETGMMQSTDQDIVSPNLSEVGASPTSALTALPVDLPPVDLPVPDQTDSSPLLEVATTPAVTTGPVSTTPEESEEEWYKQQWERDRQALEAVIAENRKLKEDLERLQSMKQVNEEIGSASSGAPSSPFQEPQPEM